LIRYSITSSPSGIGVMGRKPGPEVNGKRCTSKPMNRPKGGTLALQDGEEVRDPNSKLVLTAKEAGKEVLGTEPKTTVCLGGLDMRFYTEKNIQTITYGPGILGNAHIADEYLPLEEFNKMSDIYYTLLRKLLRK